MSAAIISSEDKTFDHVQVEYVRDVVIIKVLDDIVSEYVDNFTKLLDIVIKQRKFNIVIDFSDVDYMCSFALGMVVHLLKKVREKGGDMCLCGVGDWLTNLFTIARVSEIIKIVKTKEEAIEFFEKK